VTKPSYSLAFNKPVLPVILDIICAQRDGTRKNKNPC
jgi:hypothetical protein